MKTVLFTWLRRWQFPLLLLLSFMPVMLTSLAQHAPNALPSAYLLFSAYALASGACLAVPGPMRLPCALISSALLAALSCALLAVRAYPAFLLLPAALIALLLYSLPLAARRYESDVPPYVYVVGVGVHTVVHFLHHYFGAVSGASPYSAVSTELTLSLIGYVVLLLLSMNRISLDNASLARHRLPGSMRALNTALTLAFTALSLLLAALPAIVRAIHFFWRAFSSTLRRLAAWLLRFLPSVPDVGGGAPGAPGLPEFAQEAAPASAIAQLLEKIASILSLFFFVAGGLFLLYMLARWLMRLLRRMSARLRSYMVAASAEYDDEITDTREDGAQPENGFTRRVLRRSAVFDATPAGRIRQSYARLLRRNPKWAQSATARETLPESAAALYERARYSDHPVTGEDAERCAAEIKKA